MIDRGGILGSPQLQYLCLLCGVCAVVRERRRQRRRTGHERAFIVLVVVEGVFLVLKVLHVLVSVMTWILQVPTSQSNYMEESLSS